MRCFKSDPMGKAMYELARLRAALMNPQCHADLSIRSHPLVNQPGTQLTVEHIDIILKPLFGEDHFESFVKTQTHDFLPE